MERNIGDLLFGLFIAVESLQMALHRKRYQALLVRLEETSFDKMKLGSVYDITGVLETNCFHAWSCEPFIPRPITIESKITSLFPYLLVSPWKFVYHLASNLGSNIYPASGFIQLKMGILLSLASFNLKSIPVPIIAIGDTLIAHHLFNSATRYSDRCIYPTLGQPLSGQLRKDNWYEAGSLLLAKGGICYLGDWEKYIKEKDGFVIRSAIESNIISLNGHNLPLECTVWTYWSTPTKNKDKTHLQTLINIFGMPFLSYPGIYEDFILTKYNNKVAWNTEQICLNDNEMRQFLLFINSRNVKLSEGAQQMISNYFVASRRIRPGCLPLGALKFLTALAEAHARLSLRDEALTEDVAAVLFLYEESIQVVFGSSNHLDLPAINVDDFSQVDEEMKKFCAWLEKYISIIQMPSTTNSFD